jgi:hypothetical protein
LFSRISSRSNPDLSVIAKIRRNVACFSQTPSALSPAYRLEGFAIQPKNKTLAPVLSQPHVEVDTDQPLVAKAEVSALMG